MSSVCKKPRRRKQKTPKTWRSDCVSNLKNRFSHAFISASYKKKVKTYLKCGKIASQYFNRERLRTHSIESSGKLKISPEQHWDFTAEDLKDLGEIGRGAYGSVNKMVHKPSGQIMAVKVGDAHHSFWRFPPLGAISWCSDTPVVLFLLVW